MSMPPALPFGRWLCAGLLMACAAAPAVAQSGAPALRPGASEAARTGTGPRATSATAPTGAEAAVAGPHAERRQSFRNRCVARTPNSSAEPHAAHPAAPAQAISASDRRLMRQLLQEHIALAKMSALATSISGNDAVRQQAERVLVDHYGAIDTLRRIGCEGGVVLPGGVEADQAAVLRRLALAAGPQFDRLYQQEAGAQRIGRLRAVLAGSAERPQAPPLKDYARSTLPLLDAEMAMLAPASTPDAAEPPAAGAAHGASAPAAATPATGKPATPAAPAAAPAADGAASAPPARP